MQENIFEKVRVPAIIVFTLLGVYFLLDGNYRNMVLAFAVAIIWTRQFDVFISRLFKR